MTLYKTGWVKPIQDLIQMDQLNMALNNQIFILSNLDLSKKLKSP